MNNQYFVENLTSMNFSDLEISNDFAIFNNFQFHLICKLEYALKVPVLKILTKIMPAIFNF